MPADIETLLAEAPWLARLARSLTGSAADADDIVQETYAAALRSPPDSDRPVRPWLRRVATNVVRMRHRGHTRRAANESVVDAQAEPVRSPAQLLERAQLERRLAELVLELDEPFRTTVFLRYREGLSAEQIAKQHDIPAGTVRSRLKTALDRIRHDLDAPEHTRMRAAFPPLVAASIPTGSSAPIVGSLVMAKVKLAAVAVAVTALIVGVLIAVSGRSSELPTGPAATPAPVQTSSDNDVASTTLFVQSGVAPRRVTGRVTSDGAPFRGATVQLLHKQTMVLVASATSDADGTFDLGERSADMYVVAATAPSRTSRPVEIDLRRPTAAVIELRLVGCSHVQGTVVDGSGAPIANARIARSDARSVFAETDANGAYDLCTAFGDVILRYSASGYQSLHVGISVALDTRRDVVLIPEATVEGRVVTLDGAPVPAAWLVIEPTELTNERGGDVGGFSAADGTFRITGVSPGRNVISGVAAGLASDHRQEIVVGAGDVASGIIVTLTPSAALRGTVVAGGTPLAGVGVGMRSGSRATGVLAVTQADGSFAIDRAPLGDVALYVENHIVNTPRSIRVTSQTPPVRVDVQRMGGARGRVLRGGTPVADAQVGCPDRGAPWVFSDAAGNYVCDGLDDGPREIYASLPTGEWGKATVSIERGRIAQVDIDLTLSAMICGRVVDPRSVPVAGIDVRVSEQTTGDFGHDTSADDGSFCTRTLTGGTYDVNVYGGARQLAPDPALAAVSVGPTETTRLTITVVAPELTISGSVTDPHGVPVVDAVVRAESATAPSLGGGPDARIAITDEAGRFQLRRLAAGELTVSVTARDGSEVRRSPVAAGTRDLALTVAPAGRIEGELVGFATAPTITIQSVTNYAVVEAEVFGTRFRASGLSPGDYALVALTDARDGDITQVAVPSGQTARVTLTNRGTTTITGTVRDFRTRAPVPGMRCAGFALHGETTGAVFTGPDDAVANDANGVFRLLTTAGRITVTCFGETTTGSRVAIVQRDSPTTLDVFVVRTSQRPGSIDADLELASRRVRTVVPGGMAARAGLSVGDEIVAVDGASVAELGAASTLSLITQRPPGTVAKLAIVRGSEARSVTVTVRSE